jgi:hypothetical protein
MSFCKWCKFYKIGRMFGFEFVCEQCWETAWEYYAKRDAEQWVLPEQ